jgi:hypothetical protein
VNNIPKCHIVAVREGLRAKSREMSEVVDDPHLVHTGMRFCGIIGFPAKRQRSNGCIAQVEASAPFVPLKLVMASAQSAYLNEEMLLGSERNRSPGFPAGGVAR